MKQIISFALACLIGFPLTVFAVQNTPTADFIDNGDGTVTHKKTGLTWMRCAVGQTWTGSTCSGKEPTYTYTQAQALRYSFAGHEDWRVPTIAELYTIVEFDNYNPAINTDIFPNTPIDTGFWSASEVAYMPINAWSIHFVDGFNEGGYGIHKDYSKAIRLVRGGQPFDLSTAYTHPSYTPTSDFIDNYNGTVTHKKTGLTWMQCAMGQTWSGSTCEGTLLTYTWPEAMGLTTVFANKNDWRLPTEAELMTIVDYSTYLPASNTEVFPNAINQSFWSATVAANNPNAAWSLEYGGMGGNNIGDTNADYAIRLVRGKQTFAISEGVDLTASLRDAPDPVQTDANLTYTATIKNKGPAIASGVLLRFYLPQGVQFVSVPPSCSSGSMTVTCSIGTVVANATVSRAIVTRVSKAGGLSVAVSVHGDEYDSQPANNVGRTVTTIKP